MKNKKGTLRSVRSVLVYIRDEMRVLAEVIRKIAQFYKKGTLTSALFVCFS